MQITQQIKGITPNVLAAIPEESTIVEHCRDGGVICREPIREQNKVPVLDEDGNQRTRRYQTGQGAFDTPVWRWEDIEGTRLVKYEPRKVGRVVRNYDFQESEEEKARRARQARIEKVQEDLAEGLVDAGVSVQDLVAMLAGSGAEEAVPLDEDDGVPGASVQTDQIPDDVLASSLEGFELEMTSPGRWRMPDGSTFPEGSEHATKIQAVEHIGTEYSEELAHRLLDEL